MRKSKELQLSLNDSQINLTELISMPVEAHRVRLEAASHSVLRLSVAAGRELDAHPSHAVLPRKWREVPFTKKQKGATTAVQVGNFTIQVDSSPFGIRVTDSVGRVRFKTAPATEAGKYTDPEAGNSPFQFGEEGIVFSRRMDPGEITYGFGEVGETLNRSGNRFSLWNHDDVHHTPRQNFYCQIPFGIHFVPGTKTSAAQVCGLFLDNPGKIEVDLGRTTPGIAQYHLHTGDLVLWLLFADDLPGLLREWTGLTGRMERPPTWALGYQQCRYSYYPEKLVRQIAREFRKRKIPCDVIYLDIHYMDEFRPFTWNSKRFPNPGKLIGDLAQQGFRTVTIVDPGIKVDPSDRTFKDFASKDGYFCRAPRRDDEDEDQRRRVRSGAPPHLTPEVTEEHRTPAEQASPSSAIYFTGTVWPGAVHFPDFLRPEVRRLWGKHQKRVLLDAGVAGIWNDMNEPAVFDTPTKTFPDQVLHLDHGSLRPHKEVHQLYGMNMARASYEGIRSAQPETRPFVITRSGWAGVQRYAMLWTGDNHSTWASMLLDVQLNLSMGLTGIPMVGCDIGGFLYDGLPELFGRWIEWGVFQPFCRTHTAIDTMDQEPWSFGPEVERVCREMIGLRMRLLPYFTTLFAEAAETGAPVKRPLVWHYPDDPATHNLADQFMLGRDLLIAPVLTAATNERLVYFPQGDWVHFLTGERIAGPGKFLVQAPPGQPAVYARAGAILPLHDTVRQHTSEPEPDTTTLLIYPAEELAGRLVEDDGHSRAYMKGEQAVHEFSGSVRAGELRFRISASKGKYRPARKYWLLRIMGKEFAGFTNPVVNGKTMKASREEGYVELRIPASAERIELVVSEAAGSTRRS